MDKNNVNEISKDLKNEVAKLEKALNKFADDITLLQVGNGASPYWEGPSAYRSLKSCLAHYDHNKKLLDNLTKCSDYLEKVK